MIDLSSYERAMQALPEGVSHAEVNAERISETAISIRNGMICGSEAFTRTRLYVRAGAERTGSVYTEDTEEDAAEVILRAAENSRYSNAPTPAPLYGGRSAQFHCEGEADSVDEMLAFGAAAERAAGRERVAECRVCVTNRETRTLNSRGLDASAETRYAFASLDISLERGSGYSAQGGSRMSASCLSKMSPEALAEAAVANADSIDGGGLPGVTVPGGKYDAVFSGQMMRNILMTAWQSFSGAAMTSGASGFKHIGEKAGSEVFTLINTPSHPMMGQKWLLDAEGVPVGETVVVDKGIITSPLYTVSTGTAAGRSSTGSAGRVARMTGDLPITITTVPALIYVKPGEETVSQLVSAMGTGLLLTYSLDLYHSVNLASGEFSIPCGGVYYENGRPAGAVSQMTVAGNLRELWGNIEAVGSDLDFDDFYFKTYCVGSPSALVRGQIFAS